MFSLVVVGTSWLDEMFRPNRLGFLNVSGPVVGGHAYLICYSGVCSTISQC
jgi:hypothetical protein